jgi:hypothetical protein
MANSRRTRKVRRRTKQRKAARAVLKPVHRLQPGRTGSVHDKRTPSKKPLGLRTSTPLTKPESVRLAEISEPGDRRKG